MNTLWRTMMRPAAALLLVTGSLTLTGCASVGVQHSQGVAVAGAYQGGPSSGAHFAPVAGESRDAATPQAAERERAEAPRGGAERSPLKPVVEYALRLEGVPYRFGGSSAETGFDCSGYVTAVFREFGVSLPRDAGSMAKSLPEVDKHHARPGDLVFFNTRKRQFSHVGIYLGDNLFVHAASSKTGKVMVSDMTDAYWSKRFNGVRRAPLAAEVAAR